MRDQIDGMMVVRAELCDRLDALQQSMARASVRDLSQRIAAIRTMASAYGMIPVVCLCDAFDCAVRAQPAAAPPVSISIACAMPSAARPRTRPPAKPCSPRSRSASGRRATSSRGPLGSTHGSPAHRVRRRLPLRLGRQDPVVRRHAGRGSKQAPKLFAGLVLAALASNVVAAIAGVLIADTITIRAMTLMVALALLFAGASGLFRRKPAAPGSAAAAARSPPSSSASPPRLGDRTQFLTFALAGRLRFAPRSPRPAPPPASWPPAVPAAPARRAPARGRADPRDPLCGRRRCFLITGFITAVQALQLA